MIENEKKETPKETPLPEAPEPTMLWETFSSIIEKQNSNEEKEKR